MKFERSDARRKPIIGIIAWKNPKHPDMRRAFFWSIFFSLIPVLTETANASAARENERRRIWKNCIQKRYSPVYGNIFFSHLFWEFYLPRPAARPGRCLFGGLKFVAHFPKRLPPWNPAGPNRETFCTTGGTLCVSSVCSVSFSGSSSSRWSCDIWDI